MTEELIKDIISRPSLLSPNQASAVRSESNFIKIVAGAGSGKTEIITRRIAYLLLFKKVEPNSIVVFTFTEKAAKSVKSRIYERISQIMGEESTSRLGEMYIGTIHAYAKQILEDKFNFGAYQVFDENQEVAYIMRVGWNLGFERNHYSENCLEFLKTVNMIISEMFDEYLLKKKAPEFYNKFKGYELLLEESKRLTFNTLLRNIVLKLRKNPETLQNVKYLLVDEYQDINRVQSEFIDLIARTAELFVVGDPRQSIYQWRGSNEKFFEEFTRKYSDVKEFSLNENRRSLKNIVHHANIFADTFNSVSYDHLSSVRKGHDGTVLHVELDEEKDEADWICEQILRIRKENNLNYSDFGILLRSVNTSGKPILDNLRKMDIPFLVGGKVGLFKRLESQAIGKIFAWLYDDGYRYIGRWAKGLEPITTREQLLLSALEDWRTVYQNEIPDAIERFHSLRIELDNPNSKFQSFSQIFHYIINSLGYLDLNPNEVLQAAIMANLGRFDTLISDYQVANRLGGKRASSWQSDIRNFFWFLNTYATQSYEEQSFDDLRMVNAVQVMTVHQAKGLEWPVVFLPCLTARRFPSIMSGTQQSWCGVPRDLFEVSRYEGGMEEERRLFYVAITRARDALFLSSFRSKGRNSPFISDLEVATFNGNDQIIPIHADSIQEKANLQTFSAKELIIYDICPQLFRFSKIWGYQPGFNENLGYGEALHYCLRIASELVKSDGLSAMSAISTSVDENFHMPFVSGKRLERAKMGAKRTLIEFVKKHGDDLHRTEEVEYRLEFPLQGTEVKATIMGKVDVILKNGESIEVREYKTSEEARRFEHSAKQLHLYAIGLKNKGMRIDKGTVAYLKENDLKNVDTDEMSLKVTKQNASNLVNLIVNKKFEANPGNHCLKCDYQEICKWKKNE